MAQLLVPSLILSLLHREHCELSITIGHHQLWISNELFHQQILLQDEVRTPMGTTIESSQSYQPQSNTPVPNCLDGPPSKF